MDDKKKKSSNSKTSEVIRRKSNGVGEVSKPKSPKEIKRLFSNPGVSDGNNVYEPSKGMLGKKKIATISKSLKKKANYFFPHFFAFCEKLFYFFRAKRSCSFFL